MQVDFGYFQLYLIAFDVEIVIPQKRDFGLT